MRVGPLYFSDAKNAVAAVELVLDVIAFCADRRSVEPDYAQPRAV